VPHRQLDDYIHLFLKRKGIIFLITMSALVIAAVGIVVIPKVYRASSIVSVKKQTPEQFWLPNHTLGPRRQNSLETYRQMALSHFVAEITVAQLEPLNIRMSTGEIRSCLSTDLVKNTSDLIAIIGEHQDPGTAQALSTATATALETYSLQLARKEAQQSQEFIKTRLHEIEQLLGDVDQDIQDWQQEAGVLSEETEVPLLITELQGIRSEYRQLAVQMRGLRARREKLQEQWTQQPEQVSQTVENPLLEEFRTRLMEVSVELAQARSAYTEDHPQVHQLREKVAGLEEQLEQERTQNPTLEVWVANPLHPQLWEQQLQVERELEELKSTQKALSQILAETLQQFKDLPGKLTKIKKLQRNREVLDDTFKMLLEKQVGANIVAASKMGDVQVINEAPRPRQPINPSPFRTILTALVLGLAIGLGTALFSDLLDATVRDASALEQDFPITSLGSLPQVREPPELITWTSPKATLSEAFRNLRSNLRFIGVPDPLSTLLVTSPGVEEGKTTIVANLGVVMAQSGYKVIVVDADLRKPRLHEVFQLDNSLGLAHLLVGETTADEALQTTPVEGLQFLSNGGIPPNPVELLESERMREIVQELQSRADMVLFDTPPCVHLGDALGLAAWVQGRLLVLRAGYTNKYALQEVIRRFEAGQRSFSGFAINQITEERGRDYYSYYYHREYYGKQDTE